ncbi:MAG: right-handed parallel beta-helix repeat-containing protein [Candidatus Eisenbacteria bacterium]
MSCRLLENATGTAAAAAMVAALLIASPSLGAVSFVEDLGDGAVGAGTMEDPYRDLQTAIDLASDGDVLRILPGTYRADVTEFTEELCGNCENHRTTVQATVGFVVTGKVLHLAGGGPSETILKTGSGYGLYFEDSRGSVVTGLTITGGTRDPDGMATDAGVVARRSTVTLTNLEIVDNTDRADDVVVGVGGVMGREGAELFITNCVIRNNGWDGVALYRGATAFIADNDISVGRGAGIGVTWDATATVIRNRVSGYWKGIGSFGSSRVVARNNAVFDNLGWGMVVTGTSYMEAANNVIARNGNCGFALWSDEATGIFTNNIVTANGWREEWVCPQVGVWMNGVPEAIEISYNDVWGNTAGDYGDMDELTGSGGNISLDPAFVDSFDFRLSPESPCLDAGNPLFTDPDGGPADMGIYGGPAAR